MKRRCQTKDKMDGLHRNHDVLCLTGLCCNSFLVPVSNTEAALSVCNFDKRQVSYFVGSGFNSVESLRATDSQSKPGTPALRSTKSPQTVVTKTVTANSGNSSSSSSTCNISSSNSCSFCTDSSCISTHYYVLISRHLITASFIAKHVQIADNKTQMQRNRHHPQQQR